MNKFKKIILITLSMFLILLNINKVMADKGEPTQYINTIFAVNLCGPGSSLTACLNPVLLGSTTDGTTMDLSTVAAGAAAGTMGNLNAAVVGTTYSFAQVILSRAMTLTGTVGSCVTKSGANFDIDSPSVVGGASSGTAVSQIVGIPSGSTIGSNMIGTTSTNGINGTDNSSGNGNIADAENNVKFRFALSTPYTHKVGKLPTFTIAFDLSEAIEFSDNCTSSVTPGPPAVTASFSN
ncbi:hypothetical protein OAL80_04580 [Pelagibacteraceae bacterium]|nr:hypothetical protein [Pelagibacteraceae bacterium]